MYISFGQYVIFAKFLVCLVRSQTMYKDDKGGQCPAYDMIRQVNNEVVNQCLAVTLAGSINKDVITSWNNYYTTISNVNNQLPYKVIRVSYNTFLDNFNKSIQPKTMESLKKCLMDNGNIFGENIMNDDLQCPVKNMH